MSKNKKNNSKKHINDFKFLFIIFVVAIITILTMACYFKKNTVEVFSYWMMTDINIASQTMIDFDVCKKDSSQISLEYNNMKNNYNLSCDLNLSEFEKYIWKIQENQNIKILNISSTGAIYEYKWLTKSN